MSGTMVITSKEPYKLPVVVPFTRIEERKTDILWFFNTSDEASKAARIFADLGFEYVYRPTGGAR